MSEDGRMVARRRAWAALFAAFLISLPFVWLPVPFGWFGLVVWACLFVPALLGILLVQLPLKVALSRDGAVGARVTGGVVLANVGLVFALGWLTGLFAFIWTGPVLAVCAVLAAMLWNALDDRAVAGPYRYSQGRHRA